MTPPVSEHPRGFASDNNSGAHPEVLAAIDAANEGHVIAYGDDDYTANARKRFRKHFGTSAEAFFMFNGTGANVASIDALTKPFEGVICTDIAHMNVDECGAPERIAQTKLLTVANTQGKLTPEDVGRWE
ncbi:MAG: threonine aldolase, partial [Actinobacteria bacterium]